MQMQLRQGVNKYTQQPSNNFSKIVLFYVSLLHDSFLFYFLEGGMNNCMDRVSWKEQAIALLFKSLA